MTSRGFDLAGKIAVVTGAAGILGPHFASGLAEFGADVALIDLDASALAKTAETIGRRHGGRRVIAVPCDITAEDQVRTAIARVERELGEIDILHNNAATKGDEVRKFFEPLETFELETWRKVMAVNIDAMFMMAREVGQRMAARRRGSIIQTASIYGVVAPDQRIYEGSHYLGGAINTPPVYSASKSAVIGLTRHLAAYWGPSNVRVNAITPGGVESGQNETFSRLYSARVPLGRMARADELVGALVFLASDASSYVTGQNIVVDGGLTAW